ncbi:inactive serine/threonine-protein kinase VRK3 [Tympanuchus pallidicinctus]|uniref:inactive serine/threonine-protein kinase VRK3 n=1 Tax=Tympanuchus pallidicinctus TaxID=109042 RepID=UPI002286E8BF|nr:inactive serine/threonine-protein kinase VRK3 [Tympanuchus pallidicinctus]
MAMRGRGRRSRGRGRGAVGAARDGGAELQEEEQQEPPRVCHRVTRFCPQCGGGVEPTFRFCPACGDRLPAPPPPRDAAGPPPPQAPSPAAAAGDERSAAVPVLSPPAARTPPRPPCLAARRGSPSPRKARPGPAEPLPEGEELRDRGGGRWRLQRLLEQGGGCGLLYEAQSASGTCPQKQRFSLKLDVKDSKIYNEQNFFQRAAKKDRVEKWKKLHSLPLLGIPSCLGFGLHADKYRFLVFSDLGRSLQSILNDNLHLNEKAAFQIAVRLLDCLEYLHENEYVHGDITADNIYVNPADLTQVTLAGYYFAFRYCPEGKHVARREGSRTPHEGTIEFISQDSHRGAAPSRRSDLESLGYCLLKWLCSFLPWSKELDKVETVMEKKEMYKNDVTCLLQQCFSRQRSIPAALQSYLQQVMALEYEEKPNYEALRQLFKKPLQMLKASAYDSVDIMVVP